MWPSLSAQWERPCLSRLKDTYTVTTFHCVSRTFEMEIKLKYFSIRQAMYLGTHLLNTLNRCIYKMDYVMQEPGRTQDQVCQMRGALPTLQTHNRAHWEAETVTLLKYYPTFPHPASPGAPTSAVQFSSPMPGKSQHEREVQLLLPACSTSRTRALTAYTVCKYRLRHERGHSHKQTVTKGEFMIVTSIGKWIPKTH